MTNGASTDRRVALHGEVGRGDFVEITINGQRCMAYAGETVATALMAMGIRSFRRTARAGAPRGLYCGMGVCYDCLVVVNGRPNTRACMTYVRDSMEVQLQEGWAAQSAEEVDR